MICYRANAMFHPGVVHDRRVTKDERCLHVATYHTRPSLLQHVAAEANEFVDRILI
jgi:hypothetical protein